MATDAHSTPAPYKLGRHPRRPTHYALLTADVTLQNTFWRDITRAEITADLARAGLVLHDDDTVTRAADAAPTRRGILSGLAAAGAGLVVAVPGVAAAAEQPDAELVVACAHFERLEAAYRASCEGDENADLACPDGYDEAWNVLAGISAQTMIGLRAKARALVAMHAPDYLAGDAVTWSLVRDVAGAQL